MQSLFQLCIFFKNCPEKQDKKILLDANQPLLYDLKKDVKRRRFKLSGLNYPQREAQHRQTCLM